MMRHRDRSGTYDIVLLLVVIALVLYGLLILYSVSLAVGDGYIKKQLLWVVVGAVAGIAMYSIPYTLWRKLAVPLMVVTVVMLILTLVLGGRVFGARRGLLAGGRSVQTGVLARLVAVIYVAAWLSSKGELLNQMSYGLFPFGVIIGLFFSLVAAQKDLSTAMLIAVTGMAMFFFAGGDPLQIALAALFVGATGGFLSWLLKHARERIISWLASFKDPSQMHDQVRLAIQAIGDGGILGTGLGIGRLKFGYLPVVHTDSIFAVVGEEMGLVGCLLVIGLFILLTYRGYRVALGTADPFGSLVAFGVTVMIVSEALLNVAVMVGLFPPTGTALPFFSYGGTEMVVTLAGIGLVLGISRGRPKGDWDARLDRWWRNWRARLSGSRRHTSFG